MTILNVIDRRTRKYRWRKVDAVVEPTHQDNRVKDSDQCDPPNTSYETLQIITYDDRVNIALSDAVKWANELPYGVTLYIYDPNTLDQGTKLMPNKKTTHYLVKDEHE